MKSDSYVKELQPNFESSLCSVLLFNPFSVVVYGAAVATENMSCAAANLLKDLLSSCLHTLLCWEYSANLKCEPETMQQLTCSHRTLSACWACPGSDGHETTSGFFFHPSPAAWTAPPAASCLGTGEDRTGLLLK